MSLLYPNGEIIDIPAPIFFNVFAQFELIYLNYKNVIKIRIMKREKIIIGSRGSSLAMIYAENVKANLKEVFSKEIEIKKIVTTGDENQKDRLSKN